MSVQFRVLARIERAVSHVSAQLRDVSAISDVSAVSDVSRQFRMKRAVLDVSAQFQM